MLIECDQIPNEFHTNCSIFGKNFILNNNQFQSRMKFIQSAVRKLELKLHLPDGT